MLLIYTFSYIRSFLNVSAEKQLPFLEKPLNFDTKVRNIFGFQKECP